MWWIFLSLGVFSRNRHIAFKFDSSCFAKYGFTACKQVPPPGYIFIFFWAEEPGLTHNKNCWTATCSIISSHDKRIKGSQIHPLEWSCLGYCLMPHFCQSGVPRGRCVDPASKKTAFYLTQTVQRLSHCTNPLSVWVPSWLGLRLGVGNNHPLCWEGVIDGASGPVGVSSRMHHGRVDGLNYRQPGLLKWRWQQEWWSWQQLPWQRWHTWGQKKYHQRMDGGHSTTNVRWHAERRRGRVKQLVGGCYDGSTGKMRTRSITMAVKVVQRSQKGGGGDKTISTAGSMQVIVKQNINNLSIFFYQSICSASSSCFIAVANSIRFLPPPPPPRTCDTPPMLLGMIKALIASLPPSKHHHCCHQPAPCSDLCKPLFIHVFCIHLLLTQVLVVVCPLTYVCRIPSKHCVRNYNNCNLLEININFTL